MSAYKNKSIFSDKNREFYLNILVKDNKLYISCHYFIKYFKTKFEKEYTLEELIATSDYYKQFKNVNQIIEEFKNNQFNEMFLPNEQLFELQDPKKIQLVINFPRTIHNSLRYVLEKKEKTEEEKIEEYKIVIAKYEARIQINGMNSKIVTTNRAKELLKVWISPINHLKANLLYSFETTYPKKLDYSIFSGYNFKVYDEKDIKEFHSNCDGVQSILVICKSGTQIFGGYTPLYFSSDNTYKKDNDSFLFSLNHERKYPKNNFKKNESIWGYKDFGPCFYYDLQFTENQMNFVTSEKTNYLIPDDFIKKEEVIKYNSTILLESLEVYNIIQYIDH